MAASHTPASVHDTPLDPSPLTLASSVESGFPERFASRVDGHLAAFAKHMREGLLAASTAVGLDVMAELSTPARYVSSSVLTAKACRRSRIRGRHVAERGVRPARVASRAKVCCTLHYSSRVPVVEMNIADVAAAGRNSSRSWV